MCVVMIKDRESIDEAAMAHLTLAERRCNSTRTARDPPKPLAVNAIDIVSGVVPLRSPLERLTSRRYLEQLIENPADKEILLNTMPHDEVVPGGKALQVQQKNKSGRSREGRPIARRGMEENTAPNTDTRPNKESRRREAGDQRMIFWDSIRTQLKMASEEDTSNSGESDGLGKPSAFISHPDSLGLSTSTKRWTKGHLFPPSS